MIPALSRLLVALAVLGAGCHDPAADCCAACKSGGSQAKDMQVFGPRFFGNILCYCEDGTSYSLPPRESPPHEHVECKP